MDPEERERRDRLIADFIAENGVTKCPPASEVGWDENRVRTLLSKYRSNAAKRSQRTRGGQRKGMLNDTDKLLD